MTNKKPKIVLVADRTLSAGYKILFEGIFATMQTTQVPEIAMRNFVSPKMKANSQGQAFAAPLGLRRVQSALLNHTDLTEDDIICTTPEKLPSVLGPHVEIVAVSSSDPMGNGMSNTTTTSFWSGELYTKYWTRKMLQQINAAKQKYNFKVIGGGPGAWQWITYPDEVAKQTIDVVFEGYFERLGPKLFTDILNGQPVENHITEDSTAIDHVRPIQHPSMLGILELSRGCGRGCKFCTMAHKKNEHLPIETIIEDLKTNVNAGLTSVVSGSEDFFRYGSPNLKPTPDRLCMLLEEMQKIQNLSFMQIDHGNVATIAQLTDAELKQIRQLLTWKEKNDYLWVNMGIESANGQLVAQNCPGKISPFKPDDWDDLIRQTADKMSRCGFFSVFSLVLGMPGETPTDVTKTLKLVKHLEQKQNAVIFPIFFEPLSNEQIAQGIGFNTKKMTADHLELYRTCYEINFRLVPKLFWDNQRAGGVSFAKRAAMRILGKTEVRAWRKMFIKVGKEIEKRTK